MENNRVEINKSLYTSGLDQRGNLCDQKHVKEFETMAISTIKKQAESVACLMLSEKLEKLASGNYRLRQIVTLANRIENDVKNGVIKIASPRSAIESEEKILFGEKEPFRNEPAPGCGTAFFIGGRYVLTAGHCVCRAARSSHIPCLETSDCEEEQIKKMKLVFDFKMEGVNQCKKTFPASDVYDVQKVLRHQFIKIGDEDDHYTKWMDWAIIELTEEVKGREPLVIDYFRRVAKDVHLYMLGHPSGLPIKLTKGGVVKKDDHGEYFECHLDAFSGNSGSPVFDLLTQKVIGILCGGVQDYEVAQDYKGTGQMRIQAHRVKMGFEKCQRMRPLLVEVDRCNILKLRRGLKLEEENFIQSLKKYYTSQKNIPRLLHETPVPIDNYVQLVLLQEEIKKPDDKIEEDEQEKHIYGMHRTSWEEIQGSKKAIDLDKLFDKSPNQSQAPKRILIMGKAGVGKSTLCHHIANQWAKGLLWKDKFGAVFWVQLRKLQEMSPNETVSSFLFRSCCHRDHALYPAEVMDYIKSNHERILFLLDGYDEVDLANEAQKKIVDELQKNSHWILTSRPYAAQDIQADATVENVGFTAESIKSYIQKLFPEEPDKAKVVIEEIFQNPIIFDLCHIPINLELVSTILEKNVHAQKSIFSIHSMSNLYQVLTRTLQRRFLERMGEKNCWKMKDGELEEELRLNKDYSSVFEFLEAAAWIAIKKNQFLLSFDKGDLLQDIYTKYRPTTHEEQQKFREKIYHSGFLQSYQGSSAFYQSQHSFLHLTFQEFFAARYLVRLLQSEKRQSVDEASQSIKDIKFNPRYKIVMWFIAGLLKDDAKNLNHFFDLLDSPKDIIGLYSTLLKVRCLEECGWTDKLKKVKEYEEEVRWWCSLVTRPTLWRSIDRFKSEVWWSIDRSKSEVWGSIDRFMSEVFEISPVSMRRVLSPILVSLLKKEGYNYWNLTGQTGLLVDPKEGLPLIRNFMSTYVYEEYNLGELFDRIGQTDIQYSLPLIKALLKSQDHTVRKSAVRALGQLGQMHLQSVLPLLLKTLEDEDKYVRSQTVEALAPFGKVEPKAIYPRLIKAFEREEKHVKGAIIKALSLAEQVEFRLPISILAQAVTDEDDNLRWEAIKALGYVDSKSALELLKEAVEYVNTQNNWKRVYIPLTIGQLWQSDPPSFIDLLLTCLFHDHSVSARIGAAMVLGEIGKEKPELAKYLKSALINDKNDGVGKSAAIALGQIAQVAPEVIPDLESILLRDQRQEVRCGAAIGLGYAGKDHSLTVLPILEKAFKDNEYVKIGVVKALSMMPQGTNLQFAIPFLMESLILMKSLERLNRRTSFRLVIAASRLVDWSFQIEHIEDLVIARSADERVFLCTPLSSLIQNYSRQPIDHPDYLLAIAVKCIEENTVIFLKGNHLCCYEKGEILSIKDVPDAKGRASKIQQTIKNLPEQIEKIKKRK